MDVDAIITATQATFAQAALGLVLAASAATFLGLLAALYPFPLQTPLTALAVTLKATPVVAFFPLVQIWLGVGFVEKVMLATLISFFPVYAGFISGVRSVPMRLQKMCYSSGGRLHQYVWRLGLVYGIHGVAVGMKTAAPLAVVGAAVAGALGGKHGGIGEALMTIPPGAGAQRVTWILIATGLGIVFYSTASIVCRIVERRFRLDRL